MLTEEEKERIKYNATYKPCYGIDIYGREFMNKHLSTLVPGEIVLELGTWMGGTLQYLAKNNPNLVFHTIDLCNATLWNRYATNPQSKLHLFLQESNIKYIDPNDIIEVQKAHIEDYKNIINHVGDSCSLSLENISALLIDANHLENYVLKELEYYYPRMKKNRFIFMDDFNEKPVRNAIAKFRQNKTLRFKGYGTMACIYT